jgi:hypothetical protein
MTASIYLRIEALEEEIEELLRQKSLLQSQYDFADFIETHNLVDLEIEKLRQEIREERERLQTCDETDEDEESLIEEEEEEEEVDWSPRSGRNIEHVIRDADDRLRPVRAEDLYVERNRGVMEAFRYLYRLHKEKQTYLKPGENPYQKSGGVRKLPKSYRRE